MSRHILAIELLLLGLSGCANAETSSQPTADYSLRPAFDEHKAACSDFKTREEAASHVAAAGWQKVADVAKSQMGAAIARTDEFGATMKKRPGGNYEPTLLYQKKVAGREMFITVTQSGLLGKRMIGCRLFDLSQSLSVVQVEAEKLVGRPVSQVQSVQGIRVLLWLPGLAEPQPNFEIWQIPPGSPAAIEQKFDGLMLRADFIGEANK